MQLKQLFVFICMFASLQDTVRPCILRYFSTAPSMNRGAERTGLAVDSAARATSRTCTVVCSSESSASRSVLPYGLLWFARKLNVEIIA